MKKNNIEDFNNKKRILVNFILVSHGVAHSGQFVGNWSTSPWRSSSVNCDGEGRCGAIVCFSPVLSPSTSSWV